MGSWRRLGPVPGTRAERHSILRYRGASDDSGAHRLSARCFVGDLGLKNQYVGEQHKAEGLVMAYPAHRESDAKSSGHECFHLCLLWAWKPECPKGFNRSRRTSQKMTRRLPEGPWDPTKIPRIQISMSQKVFLVAVGGVSFPQVEGQIGRTRPVRVF